MQLSNSGDCTEEYIPPFEVRLVQLRRNSSTSLKKSKVSSTNLRDELQFVNMVKRLVFDLTKMPFLERLISIPRLIVQFSTIRIFSQNRIWVIGFRVMSSFVQVVISQNELKLLGRVEK